MIGSLFKELPPISEPETEVSSISEDLSYLTDTDDSLVASLPVVQKIVQRRIGLGWVGEASDLVQGIALRLLNWRNKYQDKSEQMSPDEWQDFAARTTYNELNRQFKKGQPAKISLDEISEIKSSEFIQGQSKVELESLVQVVWQEICSLTLRQRRALLLHTLKLSIYLKQGGVTNRSLAESLEISEDEWIELEENIPLYYSEIAELFRIQGSGKSLESLANSFRKARFVASEKIQKLAKK